MKNKFFSPRSAAGTNSKFVLMKKLALSKKIGWPILIFLVFLDAFITFIRGGRESNPLWKPLVNQFGPNTLWFLAILVLVLFYFAVKYLGIYVNKYEKYPQGEEIILTNFVIAFTTYDLYILFALPYVGFLGTRSHYAIIPILIVPILIYNLWIEYRKKK